MADGNRIMLLLGEVSMGSHLWNLLAASWRLLLDSLSTSTLSISVFSVLTPLGLFLLAVISQWRKGERSWTSFVNTIRATLKLGVVLTVVVEVLVWFCLFAWAAYKSVYNDHQNLAGRLRSLVNEKNDLKESLRVRDEYIQRLEVSWLSVKWRSDVLR